MNLENSVSAVVPVRNEQSTILRAVQSLAAQPEILEILVVDDQSTDGTVPLLKELAGTEPKLCLLEAGPLPSGWVGKNHAVWCGVRQARGSWLLFTDSDVVHLPGSARKALSIAEASGAAMVSFSPLQEMHAWWERALIPFVFCRLSQLYPYAAVNDPRSPVAAANGQFLLIRRDAYAKIGGHAAVSSDVLEDVALARRAKAAGVPLCFLGDDTVARVRMYESFAAMWEGWTKNLVPLITASGRNVPRELLSAVPWDALLCLGLGLAHPAFAVLGGALLAARHARYALLLRRNRFPLSGVIYYTVAALLYGAVLLDSRWRHLHGAVAWRGRKYPGAMPGNAPADLSAEDRMSV